MAISWSDVVYTSRLSSQITLKLLIFATSELTSDGPVMKRMYGMVMDLNDCHAFAPSIFAASISSVGMFIRMPVAISIW